MPTALILNADSKPPFIIQLRIYVLKNIFCAVSWHPFFQPSPFHWDSGLF